MRIIFLTLTFGLMACISYAKPIKPEMARNEAGKVLTAIKKHKVVAKQFLTKEQLKANNDNKSNSLPTYYAFNAEDGKGFVIMHADDEFPEVVAYNTELSLNTDAEMPQSLKSFLEAYGQYVNDVRNGIAKAPEKEKGDVTGDIVVAPLITSKWDQGSPYNYYCPNNTYVGCVATALAQIMYYYKYPETGKGSISYNCGQGTLAVDFTESHYDWSSYKDTYSSMEWKKDSGKAIAKLCLDAGAACKMQYGSGGSSSTIFDAYNAFFTYFGYDAQALTAYLRECVESSEQWERIVKAELNSKRPVLYAGSSTTGSGRDAGGHAFIIDGYDSNFYVHVNWGWSGNYDGYYDIDILDGANYQFSEGQQMIVGIKPDPQGTNSKRKQFPMIMESEFVRSSKQPVAVDAQFNMKVGAIFNISPYSMSYTISVALYDYKGNFISEIGANNDAHVVKLQSNQGYSEYGMVECKLKSTPTAGAYLLSVVSKEAGFDQFELPYTTGGRKNNAIPVYIHDGYINFYEYPTAIDDIDIDANANVIATDYFNAAGMKLNDWANYHGTLIKRQTLSNGKTKTTKIMK